MNSRVFIISDHHFNHEDILKYSPMRHGTTIEEHNEWLVQQHNSVVKNGDRVYFLGDVAMKPRDMRFLHGMYGQKFLVRGNHDKGNVQEYLKYFQNIYGIIRKEHFWLTHAPVHPSSLRGGYNVHGHMHRNTVKEADGVTDDPRYINVCIEHNSGIPVALSDLRKKYPKPKKKE